MFETRGQRWALYMDTSKEASPERWGVNLLLRMLPQESDQDISLRCVQNMKTVTYAKLREQVVAYCASKSKTSAACTWMHRRTDQGKARKLLMPCARAQPEDQHQRRVNSEESASTGRSLGTRIWS